MRPLLLLLLLSLAYPVMAQIFKYTDAAGNTAYSNQPPNGVDAQTVDLPPVNSIQRQLPSDTEQPAAGTRSRPTHNDYNVLELSGLPTAGVVRANNGTFTVDVLIEPRLQGTHLLRLLLDGQPYGQPSNVPSLQLINIDRGEHGLAVQVIDGERVVQQSPTATVTVQRAHKR
ncbi:DUF4124 domain-containing protein [Pseudomonas sp. P8_241]|uniref:DUF4124 domain-containing protein n=1 Tax=Pseudomonas sp. P8_241 TaxID=3043445 RepID=UPI002A35DD88|nr:DUF4124 domain-containing protein [Pseudomonas sp. P8_241]WPN47532.1 DUF4124 domain-containing protein [Pseudomonas sp. P8_241]